MQPERYGSYLVYEQIGKGGMATVHRAEQETRSGTREIALKRLLPTHERELVALFLDEGRLLRMLDHPNIAATYDSGRVFGTYFIAMEYVRGPTLKQLVEHCAVTIGGVPEEIALNLSAQLCAALDHAHTCRDAEGNALGIIHRDVTPSNIIINDAGVLKLIDFGLAKANVMQEHTGTGVIKGKYGYIAPEYMADGVTLDHRADLWAVGIILYELLTGRRLFDGADAFETIKRVRGLPIPRPSLANPNVSAELDDIVLTALDRDPARRWSSAAAMRERIQALIATQGCAIDQLAVAEWVRFVFEQQRGRPPRLTPIVPLAMRRPPSDYAETVDAADEATMISGPPELLNAPAPPPVQPLASPRAPTSTRDLAWLACAVALAILTIVGVGWRLCG